MFLLEADIHNIQVGGEPDKKRQHQSDRCSYNHQKPFQNLHVISSLQRSWYLF